MRRGFTLVELLIYTTIFAIVAITLAYIVTVFLRLSTHQLASAEVSNQANFVLQRIQNYITTGGFLVVNDGEFTDTEDDERDSPLGTVRSRLVIKPADDVPIVIYQNGPNAVVKVGSAAPEPLNSSKVAVDTLTFTKLRTPPGRDTVQVNLVIRFNSARPTEKIARQFLLGVGKASAAVFDTILEPASDNTANIGSLTKRWKDIFLSGNLNLDGVARLGSGSDVIGYLRQGTISVNPPSIGSGSRYVVNISRSGVNAGDIIFLTPPYNIEAGLLFVGAHSTTTDRIGITLYNYSANDVDGAARNWLFLQLR